MGGPNQCVSFNLQNNAVLEFSQIVAITATGRFCTVDVLFMFPDISEVFVLPKNCATCTFPVFTNQTQFFVNAPGAVATDVTRFTMHNSMPPPSTLSASP